MKDLTIARIQTITKLIVLSLIFISSCTAVKTTSSFDKKAAFDSFTTIDWIQRTDDSFQGPDYAYNEERRELLKTVIQEVLVSKQLNFDASDPDLLVGFHAIVEEKRQLFTESKEMMNPYSTPISYWDDYENYYNREYGTFLKGSLIVDIIDTKTGRVIWQGAAKRYMENIPNVTRKDMQKAISKMLKDFPPER
jgi:hypothetical protein